MTFSLDRLNIWRCERKQNDISQFLGLWLWCVGVFIFTFLGLWPWCVGVKSHVTHWRWMRIIHTFTDVRLSVQTNCSSRHCLLWNSIWWSAWHSVTKFVSRPEVMMCRCETSRDIHWEWMCSKLFCVVIINLIDSLLNLKKCHPSFF